MCETCEAFMNDGKPNETFRCPAPGTWIDNHACASWNRRYKEGCMGCPAFNGPHEGTCVDGTAGQTLSFKDVKNPFTYEASQKRFVCPASGAAITEATCRLSRKAAPAVCVNCLIPLAEVTADDCMNCPSAPGYGACEHCGTRPLCKKCGRPFSIQEARAGFETCEYCGNGGAA